MPTRLAHARHPSLRWDLRSLARFAALFALAAAACDQSLFAENRDRGRDASVSPDDDAGPDPDAPGPDDDADPDPDAAPPVSSCPAPCLGDAFAEFDDVQGGSSGRWNYLVDRGAANGADYDELTFAEWNGLGAWTLGNAKDGPAIARCADQSESACAGLADSLLLVPGPPGTTRPALSFRAPAAAGIRVSGAIRVADGQSVDVPVDLIVSRAGRHDAILARRISTSTEERGLDAVIPALAGDEIVVSVAAVQAQAAPPLGLRLYFTRIDEGPAAFPGSCQIAVRFDRDDPLTDGCHQVEIHDNNDGSGVPGPTVPGPGPSERLGDGRVLGQGQYFAIGTSQLDYNGDFTVQFWTRIEEPPVTFPTVLYSDGPENGIELHVSSDDPTNASECYYDDAKSSVFCFSGTRPTDEAWHFWRLVRSTAEGRLRLCIDGAEVVQTPIAADRDLTPLFGQPLLGSYRFANADFEGSFDEVRVFSEALPCPTN